MTYPPHAEQPADPYRYGAPPAPVARSAPTGRAILRSCWQLLKLDRSLIWLPVLGALFGGLAALAFLVPGLIYQYAGHHSRYVLYPFVLVGGFVASVIGIVFQAALVVGVYQRADGGDPTFGGCLAVAWRMKRQIIGWALFTSSVGAVVRAVEQRLGVFGRILGFLGGVAWAVATFFAVPAIVAEGIGPVEALKRSAHTIRQTWGTSVRTTLRLGFLGFAVTIVPVLVLIGGIAMLGSAASSSDASGVAAGAVVTSVGLLALLAVSAVLGPVGTYARALIYRWTTGRPVPGIDPALFAGAFAERRRGRRA